MKKDEQTFRDNLLQWFSDHPRPMPWKKDKDPYKIWLSEIILQQTRVAQGTPYFLHFIDKYPTVCDLANATEDQVMRSWQGLGYYSRARNLHKAAKFVCNELDAKFPQTIDGLQKLPGVGPYSAAAISSFAFEAANAVVDGNVLRVISRVFGIDDYVDQKEGKNKVFEITQGIIASTKASDYNQAIMNFGATHCVSKNPNCKSCVMSAICKANKDEKVAELPRKAKKIKKKIRFMHFFMCFRNSDLIIQKRSEKDIWQGLYQFPLIEKKEDTILTYSEKNQFLLGISNQFIVLPASKEYNHILTHQNIKARFHRVLLGDINLSSDKYLAISKKDLGKYAFPRLIDRYLNEKAIPLFKS